MSSSGDRATARFTVVETGESIELEYQFPMADFQGESRTATLSPIGAEGVIQHLGTKPESLTVQGHCYRDERDFIRTLTSYGKVEIRSAEFTGYAVVNDYNIEHTKQKGGKRPENTHENKNYNYRLNLTQAPAPSPGDG